MTLLPIVGRELRVAARRRGTFWNRTVSAGMAIAVFGLMFVLGAADPNRELGKQLFVVLSVLFLGVSVLTGVVYTADCISEEKREGTLGLLFLTDLKGYDVVVGKLVASSVGAVYATLAILPILAIPLLLGGVSAAEFWRVVLVLVNSLFLSLAAGVMVSAAMRHNLASMAVTLAVVIGLNFTAPLLSVWIGYITESTPPEPLLIPSVGYACAVAQEPLYLGRESKFLISVGVTHGLAWVCLVLASLRTRLAWREGTTSVTDSLVERWRRWLKGERETQRAWRRTALDANPCYWLAGRSRHKAWVVWVGLGVTGLLWLAAYAEWGKEWSTDPGVALLTVIFLHTLLRWWLAGEAIMALGPDRRSGALELILCTDLRVEEIARGRMLGLQRQFFWPAVAVLIVDLWMLSVVLSESVGGGDVTAWVALFAALIGVFLLDMTALAWLGLWWGVTCRQASRAFIRSVAVVFGIPWAIFILALVMIAGFGVVVPQPEWVWLLTAYAGVCGFTSAAGWRWARDQILLELRSEVAGTPQERAWPITVSRAAPRTPETTPLTDPSA